MGPDHGARPSPGRATLCSGAHDPFRLLSSRTPSSRKPKPQDPHEGYTASRAREHQRERALRREESGKFPPGGEIDAIAIVIERDIISIIIIIISTIYTAITTAAPPTFGECESEAFRKERDELEEIFRRQPILKHDLPVEDLGTTPPPKEDPVFDLKPLPDDLKYAHIDDKKIYPVIISSKLSEIEEERLENIAYDPVPVNDSFPNEQLAVIKYSPTFSAQQRRKFFYDLRHYFWDDPHLYKEGVDGIMRRCVPEYEQQEILNKCHGSVYGGHHAGDRTAQKFRSAMVSNNKDKGPWREEIDERINKEKEKIASEKERSSSAAPDLDSFPCVEEAIRVADEFCDQYRALRREVEILQEENHFAECWNITQIPAQGRHRHTRVTMSLFRFWCGCKIEKR
ncbi:hypothetical protein QYE76_049479 [Lolium multiflorum]|uniref:Uncharacterized protein n=1 Tax=Lolium multiflorum TaxID=4521 RepID=A0AAD8SP87_LOLMU|nr:hypothetical protein QYE76_049479 [Lolium multiflorum]